MLLETISEFWRKAKRTNATDASFPARVPTKTAPVLQNALATAAGVYDVVVTKGTGVVTQNVAQFLFYGTGSNNNTFSARVYGWSHVVPVDQDPNKVLYVPVLIAEVALTLSSTLPGVAGCPVAATELFADTITLTFGNTAKVTVSSPGTTTADSGIACVEVDFTGFPVLEVVYQITSGPTDMNALYRLY